MAKKVYRAAVVGTGGMGNHHAKSIAENKRLKLVAAMDVFEKSVNAFAEQHQVPGYTDLEKMIRKHKVNVVFVTTWQNVRAELTVLAAQQPGIVGIFGEKPMAASLGEAQQMISVCKKNGAKLVIGHQRRYTSQNIEARRLIASGAIGQPQVMLRRDGQGLLNRGTHEIDEMRYILGDPKPLWAYAQVTRNTDKWERRVRCEDRCMINICFDGGIRGIYESDLPDPGLCGHAVYGDEGILRRGDNRTLLLSNSSSAGWQVITPEPSGISQHDDFVAYLDGDIKRHRNQGEIAKVTMEIMMAVYESARSRDVVQFPLRVKKNPLDLMVEEGQLTPEGDRYDIRAPFPEQKT